MRRTLLSYWSFSLFFIALEIGNHLSYSALLTDIYGKKLSEISDFANKYLILPSTSSGTQQEQERLREPRQFEEASASPLVAAWKAGSLTRQANFGKSQQQQSSNLSKTENQELSVTTDFPNPNINNLGHEITKILTRFFLHGYDKRVRPNYSGPPALVNVSFRIIGISSVDEVQMDFTTDFYFRQKWFDPRLEFEPVGEVDELCVGAEFAEKIWLPDTFFANEKTATFHRATTENTFIRIGHNGRVYRSIRLTVTCSCPMDLQYFPMDRQRCKIEIESYGYNTRDIDYRWEKAGESVSINNKIELPQFKILGYRMGQELQSLSSGDYIRLYCEIHFVRSMGYYLIQIYIPASLIVVISWVSFWLHRNATPARVALGVTTVLTMTTLMSSANAALPKISYIKSVDVFLGTCFVMVFASLLEYASVGYIGKRIAMKRKRIQDLQQLQQQHQKVCVAAAASAAAQDSIQTPNNLYQAHKHSYKDNLHVNSLQVAPNQPSSKNHLASQTLQCKRTTISTENDGSKTLQKGRSDIPADDALIRQRSSVKIILGNTNHHQQIHIHDPLNAESNRGIKRRVTPIVPVDQRLPIIPAALPSSTGAEFEVTQTFDTITICGLTPSAIDKHSRVVFPICFVCFNLMYWIIYGHISQQIDDKGPPLIPFIRG